MRHYLGRTVMDALGDNDIEEVYVNPDTVVRFVSRSRGRVETAVHLRHADVESFLSTVATQVGTNPGPSLAATLPHAFGKCRIQGFLPPITEGPALIIRKPPGRLIPLEAYVGQGALSTKGLKLLKKIIAKRRNIIVAGPTASGKTTLCNAILAEISHQFPSDRLLILEDTAELRVVGRDHLRLNTTDTVTMRHLVKSSLRSTPNRLIIGEVRDGAAKDLLDAWITGHPGGCGTVHGEDCEKALERLSRLASEGAGGADQHLMVLQGVHYVIHIAGYGRERKVQSIAQVKDWRDNRFVLDYHPL